MRLVDLSFRHTRPPNSAWRNAGFTLIELVVTLVIIGSLAVVAAPLFVNTRDFNQAGFFNETRAAVRYAQKQAVATGCTVRVNITAGGYALFDDAPACNNTAACNAGNYGHGVTHPADVTRAFAAAAPNGVALNPSATDICFRPLGNTVGAANVTVSIVGGTQQFTIWAGTGYVR